MSSLGRSKNTGEREEESEELLEREIHEEESQKVAKIEDVRISNAAFAQIKKGEQFSMILASVGISSAIISSEMEFRNKKGEKDQDIQNVLYCCMFSSILMCGSIIMNYQLLIQWKRSKNMIIETDNLFNTGLFKKMILECLMVLVQPYPFLQGVTYYETAMFANQKAEFKLNNFLISCMIFFRIYFYARSILALSFYTDPRSQRVCNIYGSDANYSFAIKALMLQSPWSVLSISLGFSVFVFAYCLRVFEREV